MEFHDKLTIPNLGRMAVMDSVKKAEDMVLEDEYAKKQTALDFYYNRNKMRKKIKKAFQMLNRFEFEKNCYKYLFLVNKYI